MGRHLDRLFRRAGEVRASDPEGIPVPEPSERSVERASSLLQRADRPVLLVGSQALLGATGASALAETVGALGVPVYLSGMARGLLGSDHPLQLRHRRKEALREADLVILAGVPCDFRLDYGRHIGRGTALVSAGRSRGERRPARCFSARLAAGGIAGSLDPFVALGGGTAGTLPPLGGRGGEFRTPLSHLKAFSAEYHAQAAIWAALGVRERVD
ncbi:MAG: thiamine pyrophosphate-binding protein, partial [Planctomycetes bacterium]|nr:thiamine pyrophosphate-binding protein [Planctomycetota bacterium]